MGRPAEPKVTIDLKEYNELLDYKKRFQKLKVADYNTAFNIVIKHVGFNINGPMVRRDLDSAGLVLAVSDLGGERQIFVDRIKP